MITENEIRAESNQGVASNRSTGIIKRTSWSAIFAGGVIAIVAELLFSLLGLGIGASTIDPLTDANPMSGIGIGAGIWFLVTTLLSLFAGGWTAARLAGIPYSVDSILHGIITWGVATLFTLYLLTSAAGNIMGAVGQVFGQGLSLLGRGAAAAAPEIGNAVKGELAQQGVDWSDIKDQATLLLRQTGKQELNPDAIQRKGRELTNKTENAASSSTRNPQHAAEEVSSLLDRVFSKGSATLEAADRDALINVLVARTSMDRAEAGRTVDQWQKTYQQASQKYVQAKSAAKEQALQLADITARNLSRAALWTFAALLLGLGAAAFGGQLGRPRQIVVDGIV